jgi:hypothetical protein
MTMTRKTQGIAKSGKRRRPYLQGAATHTTEAERIASSQRRSPDLWDAMAKLQNGTMSEADFLNFVKTKR